MNESIHIRPARPADSDYGAIAALIALLPGELVYDFEFDGGAELRAFDQSFEAPELPLRRYIAEVAGAGQVAGYACCFQIPWLAGPRFWGIVRVASAYRRRGVGGRLYARIAEETQRLGGVALQVEVHESLAGLAECMAREGFREIYRSWPFSLDTRGFDPAPFRPALDRTAARGVTITTLERERERDPGWLPRLYALHAAISGEIPLPGYPHPSPPLEWFVHYIADAPQALPDAFFIARDGERYVGESFMHRVGDDPGALSQRVTGVLPEYRGAGIALALKLATIAYAQERGYTTIWTGVESNNPSMLAINERLGFVRHAGLILFERLMNTPA